MLKSKFYLLKATFNLYYFEFIDRHLYNIVYIVI